MYYNICYEVAAIVILVVLILARFKYFSSDNRVIKQFMNVIIMVLVTSIMNVIAALSYSSIIPVGDKLMLLIETIYLIFALLCCYFQLEVIIMRFAKGSEQIRIYNFILVALMSIVLSINLYKPFVFEYIDHTFMGYPLFNGIYVIYVILFIEMSVLIIMNKDRARLQTVILTSSIMVLPIVCILIQFIDDRILLSEFGATIAFLLYSYSLEDKDYNKLQITLKELEESRKKELENRESITRVNEVKNLFMESISEELEAPIFEVLELSNSVYEEADSQEVKEYAQKINGAGKHLNSFIDQLINASNEGNKNG